MGDIGSNACVLRPLLLVEDNPNDEELTLRALRKGMLANNIVVARDGAEALDYIFSSGSYAGQSPPELPAVVILDLKLPKVSGLEVLKRLRANDLTKLLPVVILTSSDEQRDLIKSYRLGANSYVHKPIQFHEFIYAVQQLGLYWLLLNKQASVRL